MDLAMDIKPEFFLNEIFEIEAQSMLSEIMTSTVMISLLIDFDEKRHAEAIDYIINVLKECYKAGHLQVAIQHEGETLYGFAMLFIHPHHKAAYLHKIFVYEHFRGNGLGTSILNSLTASGNTINLICPDSKIGFYENNGFNYVQSFEMPDSDNFKLSKGLYAGLSVMTNSTDSLEAPIFFLNDDDLRIIAGFKQKI